MTISITLADAADLCIKHTPALNRQQTLKHLIRGAEAGTLAASRETPEQGLPLVGGMQGPAQVLTFCGRSEADPLEVCQWLKRNSVAVPPDMVGLLPLEYRGQFSEAVSGRELSENATRKLMEKLGALIAVTAKTQPRLMHGVQPNHKAIAELMQEDLLGRAASDALPHGWEKVREMLSEATKAYEAYSRQGV